MNCIGSRCFLVLRRQLPRTYRLTCSRYLSTRYDPLRILFCGSDDFSIASLNALHAEHTKDRGSIASIDVVCRPPKRVGRGLKMLREVPIKSAAQKLSLPVHEIDTFTGWNPPSPQGDPINLIVAVSFGLFVPSRILKGAKYGGLNVHPSLLPDLRGPAPLHHALMAGDTKMGITIQTMDTKKFDYGLILDQTPAPGFDIPDPETCDVSRLLGLVSERGAEMLVNAIRNRIFIPPLKPAVQPSLETVAPLRHAPKITPEDRHIDWSSWDWEKIRRYQRVVGPLWNTAAVSNGSPDSTMPSERKRVIITKMEALDPTAAGIAPSDVEPGRPFATSDCDPKEGGIYVFTNDGTLVLIEEMKVQGERAAPAYRAALKAKLIPPLPTESSFCTFHAPLL